MGAQVFFVEPTIGATGSTRALLNGNRTQTMRFELLDQKNNVVRPLDGVSDFKAEFKLDATVRSGGSCVYRGSSEVDWTRSGIRAYQVVSAGRESIEWCIGTFRVQAPTTNYTAQKITARELQLTDMMGRLQQQSSTAAAWYARKGTNIIDRIRYLLDRQSIAHQFPDSDAVFGADMFWTAGTPYLRMTNDMLDAANFFSAYADPMGFIRAEPYQAAQYRPVVVQFTDDGPGTPYLPEFTHERDVFSVPNQVTLVGQSDDPDALPLVGTALDMDSEFGWHTTGQVRSHVETGVPSSPTQALMDERAARVLEQKQQVSETFVARHMPIPLALNNVGTFTRAERSIGETRVVIEGFTYGQSADHLSETKMRKVRA